MVVLKPFIDKNTEIFYRVGDNYPTEDKNRVKELSSLGFVEKMEEPKVEPKETKKKGK